MRLRLDEEFQDSVSRGSSLSERLKNFQIKNSFSLIAGLSQFEPGKINKKLTSKFENDSEQSITIILSILVIIIMLLDETFAKPPTKKLITLDQILNKVKIFLFKLNFD